MLATLRTWLNTVYLTDPLERRLAGLVQVMFIGLIAASFCAMALTLASRGPALFHPSLAALALVTGTAVGALLLLRRGYFRASVLNAALGLLVGLAAISWISGVLYNPFGLLPLLVPLAMVGLLLGRRQLVVVSALTVAIVAVVSAGESRAEALRAAAASDHGWILVTASFALLVVLFGTFFDRFSDTLRRALCDALAREQELERTRASLESTVAERTASLAAALRSVEEREASLVAALEELRASQATIRELGSPVLPVLPGVLVAPLVGALDAERAANLADHVLAAIERDRARHVIFDITGVLVVDTHVAQTLLRVAQAARLLGARPMLVGIRPEVAQTMVALGVDVSELATYSNLQEAVGALRAA